MRRLTREFLFASAAACAIVPPALIHFFAAQEVAFNGLFHFAAVGASAAFATAASIALTVVGARRGDGRTVLIGTAFSVMAALLVVHGIASGGVLVGKTGVVAFSGAATLPVGGALLALCTMSALRRPGASGRCSSSRACCSLGVLALGAVGMLFPSVVPAVPEAERPGRADPARHRTRASTASSRCA